MQRLKTKRTLITANIIWEILQMHKQCSNLAQNIVAQFQYTTKDYEYQRKLKPQNRSEKINDNIWL